MVMLSCRGFWVVMSLFFMFSFFLSIKVYPFFFWVIMENTIRIKHLRNHTEIWGRVLDQLELIYNGITSERKDCIKEWLGDSFPTFPGQVSENLHIFF